MYLISNDMSNDRHIEYSHRADVNEPKQQDKPFEGADPKIE